MILATLAQAATPVSNMADLIRADTMPPTFGDDKLLYGLNLGGMTAWACFGLMVAGWMAGSIIKHWGYDRPLHPVTLFRACFMFAGLSLMIRSGTTALDLWAWDPNAPMTGARVMMAKHYANAVALVFAGCWLTLFVLSYPSQVCQLRKRPLPSRMMQRLPALKRPIVVAALSLAAGFALAWLKQ